MTMFKSTTLAPCLVVSVAIFAQLFMSASATGDVEIPNGDFESPSHTPWAHADSWTGRCNVNISGTGQSGNNAETKDATSLVYQDLEATAVSGRTYTLSFYRKQPSPTYHNGNVSLDSQLIFGGTVVAATGPIAREDVRSLDNWIRYSISYRALPKDDGTPIRVAFDVKDLSELAGKHGPEKHGHAYAVYDSVTLTDGTPVISRISPSFADCKSGGQVTVYGSDLDTVTQVDFGKSAVLTAAFKSQNSERIVLDVPPHAKDVVDVKATNPLGSFTLARQFEYRMAHIVYVSMDGSDSNPGTRSQPFRTIQKAGNVMQPGDICYVRRGTYRETVRLLNIHDVTFKAYPGETVTLDGTEPITSKWTRHEGRIYKTKLKKDIWQLFVNGEMMITARWPNASFDPEATDYIWGGRSNTAWAVQSRNSSFGQMVDPNLAKTGVDMTGAVAVLNVGRFVTFARQIEKHKKGGDTFYYNSDFDKRRFPDEERNKVVSILEAHSHFWKDENIISDGRYFIEGKPDLLDSPGEWYYSPEDRFLYLWLPDDSANRRNIRGKTRTYAFQVISSQDVTLDGFLFFAATFSFDACDGCVVENCVLNSFASSKRVLGVEVDNVENWAEAFCPTFMKTQSNSRSKTQHNIIRNCVFEGCEGSAFQFQGTGQIAENIALRYIDWSGIGSVTIHGGSGNVLRRIEADWTGGSECLRVGGDSLVELCLIGPNVGIMQEDGASIQICPHLNTTVRQNWIHGHRKFGIRTDGKGGSAGERDALILRNVVWDLSTTHDKEAIKIKGDKHRLFHNLSFDNTNIDIGVPGRLGRWKHNSETIIRNNAAGEISGSRNPKQAQIAPGGKADYNFIGDVSHEIQSKTRRDFRPREGSRLVDSGAIIPGITDGYLGRAPDIGAYEYSDREYWIPGYQTKQASRPYPANGSVTSLHAELMWLGGYQSISHDVYVGTRKQAVAGATRDSPEFKSNQSNNIYELDRPMVDMTYYWRIDAVTPSGIVKGDVWSFHISANRAATFGGGSVQEPDGA